jgi:dTDP-4-dehydrorhamnose 3,5-epimerase
VIPKLIKPRRFADSRGWFSETYNREAMAALGITDLFVQDNHSQSARKGTLRGIHCQLPPRAQAKLVRCVRGAIFDVAVDLRRDSPTFGQWVSAVLTEAGGEQLYVPIGFGHGFLTLSADTEVQYKCSDTYAPETEFGVIWNDATMAIAWPLEGDEPVLSDKDLQLPPLSDFAGKFVYDGNPLAPLES